MVFDLVCDNKHTFEAWFRDSKAFEGLRKKGQVQCPTCGVDKVEEARKIHYGEIEQRDIYGEATQSEAKELEEEGVDFTSIPWAQQNDS